MHRVCSSKNYTIEIYLLSKTLQHSHFTSLFSFFYLLYSFIAGVFPLPHNLMAKCPGAIMYDSLKELEMQINSGFQSKIEGLKNFENPVLAKVLDKTNASKGYLMRFQTIFCGRHLPKIDTIMKLEIETGEQFEAKYLPRIPGLSGGWKGFAIHMKLKMGDLVVFELVEADRFKVYFIRKGSSDIKLPRQENQLHAQERRRNAKRKGPLPRQENQLHAQEKRRNSKRKDSKGLNVNKRPDDCLLDFRNISGLKDFIYVICELLQDHVIPEITLQAYYKLCCKENEFLHTSLYTQKYLPSIETVKNIIFETVDLASTLETCDLFKFVENFSSWDKTLMYLESTGMNVYFLRARLHRLHTLAFDSEGAADRRSYIEACHERQRAEIEVKKLEAKLCKLRKFSSEFATEVEILASKPGLEKYLEAYSKLNHYRDVISEIESLLADFGKFFEHYDARIETLKLKAYSHEVQFQEEANAPHGLFTCLDHRTTP